ncbi:hypothetical protein HYPSUDRAFT_36495 [Hypholoma sublateritium FD-334 SS-4]|uniref:Uncharacterized protein n=1 Tax=Hypholoma sublateritium (strain FD-334 SS-4) TaxID=945553 RepID=A0A0D2PCH0_HYPSF|nr:hypothetical protein HYPSUDRAFT_36495 [Hypholoma sublateritium FD-334 SS-4]
MQLKSDYSPEIKQEPGVLQSFQDLAIGYQPDDKADVKAEVTAKTELNDELDNVVAGSDLEQEIFMDEDAEGYMSDDYVLEYDWQDIGADPDYFEEMGSVQHGFSLNNYGPCLSRGVNRKGDYFCRHAFGSDAPSMYKALVFWEDGDPRPYHYRNRDGSIYFHNPDQSSYYWIGAEKGYSRYISPSGQITENYSPNLKAELALYCFPCHALDVIHYSKL